jgi:hypothetical protein
MVPSGNELPEAICFGYDHDAQSGGQQTPGSREIERRPGDDVPYGALREIT